MKLTKAEKLSILITVLFIAAAAACLLLSPGGFTAEIGAAVTPPPAREPAPSAPPEIIDLNAATVGQLCTLPGIGETLAQRIIDFREERGGFESTEEITLVSGIGRQTYDEIKAFITVN